MERQLRLDPLTMSPAWRKESRPCELARRGVQWVTRAKDNMLFRVRRNLTNGVAGIIKDQLVVLTGKHKGVEVRRIEAWVEIDGEWRQMVFMTNNLEWSPRTVCDLYRRRWDIEVFFKQVKQTLKLSNFLGHSANAVRWQVYAALLVYVLLRFQAYLSEWGHSFTRLFTVAARRAWPWCRRAGSSAPPSQAHALSLGPS